MPQPPNGWGDARGTMLLRSFLGMTSDFLITLYAPYCNEQRCLEDYSLLCALLDHERV